VIVYRITPEQKKTFSAEKITINGRFYVYLKPFIAKENEQ
jgi:hypothetical protein